MSIVPEPTTGALPVPRSPAATFRYVGLATRIVSFIVDAALINLGAIMVGLGATLIQGVLHLPSDVQSVLEVIGAIAYVLGTIGYFVAFWSTTGQTPGARIMQIRVVSPGGQTVKPRRALLRCFGVVLAALPLFAGFIPILFDGRRRGFQDRLAGTVVVEAAQLSVAQTRRLSRQTEYEALRQSTVPRP